MTDLPPDELSVPSRLGVSLALAGETLEGHLSAPPPVCERGAVPIAALVFLADVVAGLAVDTDPDAWTFTSDVSVRAPLVPPPERVEARSITRRAGRRSITCEVPLTSGGASWGSCFIGFARVPRRDGDLPKPEFEIREAIEHWDAVEPLEQPLRAAAGAQVRDPASGAVAMELRPDLLNPAGALQGAMVAYLAEAAAEELADHHLGRPGGKPWVVTEMEVRFLAQNRTAPIVSRASFVGAPRDGLVRVDLHDEDGAGRHTTAVVARVHPAP